MLRLLYLIFLLALSSGCSTLSGKSAGKSPDSSKPALDVIGQTPVGASFALEQKLFQVIDEYTAASGRDCRLLLEQNIAVTRVACRNQRNNWYMRQVLSSRKLSASLAQGPIANAPVAGAVLSPAEPAEIIAVDTKSDRLQAIAVVENETLWRFAKRVTGNALNWQAIAETNGIVNVNALRVGQKLRIPAQLPVLTRAQNQGG